MQTQCEFIQGLLCQDTPCDPNSRGEVRNVSSDEEKDLLVVILHRLQHSYFTQAWRINTGASTLT